MPYLSLNYPPGLTHGCCDLRNKVNGSTGERRTPWTGLFLQCMSWKMPISLPAPEVIVGSAAMLVA